MKLEIKKPIGPMVILEAQEDKDCEKFQVEYCSFVCWWQQEIAGDLFCTIRQENSYADRLLFAIQSNPKWLKFCIDHGFVGEVEEEVFYQVRDRFLFDNYGECILAQVGPHEVCMIMLQDGNRLNERVPVRNTIKITQSEMNLICCQAGTYKKLD